MSEEYRLLSWIDWSQILVLCDLGQVNTTSFLPEKVVNSKSVNICKIFQLVHGT